MKVIVSPAARDYIKSEIAYLKLRSLSAAVQFSEDLKRLKRDLGRFSQRGISRRNCLFPASVVL